MPWFVAPSVTAASPVRTPARAWMVGPRRAHRVDELEAGPDRPLGVVLVRGRRAPDRHDGVADELLDRPAVAADDVAREVEVAAQQLARLLRVAPLGERREADEVGEEDRHEAALGDGHLGRGRRRDGGLGRSGRRGAGGGGRERARALGAELGRGRVGRAAVRAHRRRGATRTRCRTWRPAGFSVPQFEQIIER